jgi:hypothetical protein
MSAISPVEPGVAAVCQLASTAPAPVSSAASSPAVQDVVDNAPPDDIVDLSLQALQLHEADTTNASAADSSPPPDSGSFSFWG